VLNPANETDDNEAAPAAAHRFPGGPVSKSKNREPFVFVESGPPDVTVCAPLGAVQLFKLDVRGVRVLSINVVETLDGETTISGVALDDPRVVELRDALTAYIDAPRDAARAAAELVTRDDELLLVKTTLGEWGVGSEAETPDEVSWYTGAAAERDARALFAKERGKDLCFGCAVEVDEDDSSPATDDGDRYCPKCAEEAKAEFNATTFGHDRGSPGEDGCAWTGPGAEIVDFDEDALCPKCDAPVQRVAVATPTTEAAP